MKYTDKAKKVAEGILDAFERGDIPQALARVFLYRDADFPATKWSWRNRLAVALFGHLDARGYRQWQKVGRQVKKGETACGILVPLTRKARDDESDEHAGDTDETEPRRILYGFKMVPVFGYAQTEGEPLAEHQEAAEHLDSLPLVHVAHHWDLDVSTFPGAATRGYYLHGRAIGVAVKNLATWLHELVHAADDRRGTLTRGVGQQLDNEAVAQFGATVLAHMLGCPDDADEGHTYRYVQGYCERHDREVLDVLGELIDRTCAAVALILETADALETPELPPDGAAAAQVTEPEPPVAAVA